jgi:hypothetical protein
MSMVAWPGNLGKIRGDSVQGKYNFLKLIINLFSNHPSFFNCGYVCFCVCFCFQLLLTYLSFILILLVCVSVCSMPHHQRLAINAKYNLYRPCTCFTGTSYLSVIV